VTPFKNRAALRAGAPSGGSQERCKRIAEVHGLPQPYRLLLAAAAARPDAERLAWIRRSSADLDWGGVVHAARSLRLGALAAMNLAAAGVEMPPPVRTAFDDELVWRTGLSLAAVSQVRALQTRFEAAGIPALAYKGPALSAQAYGHLGARTFSDLDLLVPRRSIAQARDVLAASGCRLDVKTHRLAAALPAAARVDVFFPPVAADLVIELHVAVSPWPLAVRFETERLVERAVRITAGEGTLQTLAPEDHLLVAAAHATSHNWRHVHHVSEIDGLVRAGVDWDAVRGHAERARIGRIVRVGLALARDAFATPLPPETAVWIDGDREARALAGLLPTEWFTFGRPLPRWPWLARTLRYREHAADKARFVVREQITSVLEKFPWERWRPPPRHLSSPTARP
jgi:hypothetical protein